MSSINKYFSLFFILLFVGVSTRCVYADGVVYMVDYSTYGWSPFKDIRQVAFLSYEDGTQKMIIELELKQLQQGNGVWIFPLPTRPDDINIMILERGIYDIYFHDFSKSFKNFIRETFNGVISSQIYPILFIYGYYSTYDSKQPETGIDVHKRVENLGFVSEVVSARDGESLYKYITSKGFLIPKELKSIMDEYVGKDYSFIVSWFAGNFTYEDYWRNPRYKEDYFASLFISFPTKKLYYPLKLTSLYESQRIPILIYVFKHVTPKIYPEIHNGIKISYGYGHYNSYRSKSSLKYLTKEGVLYEITKINIDTPSYNFKEDLWMELNEPSDIATKKFLMKFRNIIWLPILALFSIISALLVGRILFDESISKKKLILLGLFNILTIVGFSIATFCFMKSKRIKKEILVAFIILYSIFFVGIVSISKFMFLLL